MWLIETLGGVAKGLLILLAIGNLLLIILFAVINFNTYAKAISDYKRAIFIAIAIIGPIMVWIPTELSWGSRDSISWYVRDNSILSDELLFWMFIIPSGLAITYAVLWLVDRPLSRFLALCVNRIMVLTVQVVVGVYAVAMLQGVILWGVGAIRINNSAFASVSWTRGLLGDVGYARMGLDFVLLVLVAIMSLGGFILLISTPLRWLRDGIELTHQLFRYYYPSNLRSREALWPESRFHTEWGGHLQLDLLLASDLHVTEPGVETLEPRPRQIAGGDALDWVGACARAHRPAALLITGDLTDTGTVAQWREVATRLPGEFELFVVPGNHDCHFRHVLSGGGSRSLLEPFKTKGSYNQQELKERIQSVAPRCGEYPSLISSTTLMLDVLALDSNVRRNGWPVTNAVGLVGAEQLSRARQLLAWRDQSRALVVALHHHIIPPPFTLDAPLLLCLDREDVLQLALDAGAAVIAHGHTHQPFVYEHESGLFVVSCGSSAFSAKGRFADQIGGHSCYGLTFDGNRMAAIRLLRS